MNHQYSFSKIRPAVEAIADLVCCHGMMIEDDGELRVRLLERGFELNMIRAAEDWCDQASATGNILEILSLFVASGSGLRIYQQIEKLALSKRLWGILEDCRARGIISLDMSVRIIEGLRTLDTRDWSDCEVREFISETCGQTPYGSVDPRFEKALKGDFNDYYC